MSDASEDPMTQEEMMLLAEARAAQMDDYEVLDLVFLGCSQLERRTLRLSEEIMFMTCLDVAGTRGLVTFH